MARIAGIDIPRDKQARIALTYIYGVGPNISRDILKKAQIGDEIRMKDLTEEEITRIRLEAIDQFIDVARKAGFTKTQIRAALHSVDGKVELLAGLVDQGKFKSVELIDGKTAAERG